MTNMFKKTLLAAAVVSVSSAATAADVVPAGPVVSGSATAVAYSQQGVSITDSFTSSADVTFELAATYAAGDTITLTFAGADVDPTSNPTLSISDADGSTAIEGEIGFLSIDGNKAIFRVTEAGADLTAANNPVLTLNGIKFDSSSVASSGVSVTYSARTPQDIPIDRNGGSDASGTFITLKDQFGLTVGTPASADINVAEQRYEFDTVEGGATSATSDVITLTVANDDTLASALVDGTPATASLTGAVTLSGTFGDFIDSDGANAAAQCAFISGVTVTSCAADKVVFDATLGAAQTLTFDVSAASVADAEFEIKESDFSASAAIDYADTAAEVDTTFNYGPVDAGEWKLNGANAYIPYMPYGKNVSQILYVTNNGTQTGDVTVDVRVGGETQSFNVGQAAPGTTKITGAVLSAVEEMTGKNLNPLNGTGSEKVSLNVVVNAPEADIEVYSGYNVNGNDRGLVINSSNK